MLTPKQEAFAQAVASGEYDYATDAYQACYDAENMSREACYVEASRLIANPKVALCVKEIRDKAADGAGMTAQGHLKELESLRDLAKGDKQIGGAVRAEELRGKVSGFYVERTETTQTQTMPMEDLVDALAHDPEFCKLFDEERQRDAH